MWSVKVASYEIHRHWTPKAALMLFGIELCCCSCTALSLRIKHTKTDIHPVLQKIYKPSEIIRGLSLAGSNTLLAIITISQLNISSNQLILQGKLLDWRIRTGLNTLLKKLNECFSAF